MNSSKKQGFFTGPGRFYCALCWLKNTEESVWKRFCWWLQFPAFVCFQSVAPVSDHSKSLKNLNSPTSPIFFVPKIPSVPTVVSGQFSCDRSGLQCHPIRRQSQPIRTAVPPNLMVSVLSVKLKAPPSGILF